MRPIRRSESPPFIAGEKTFSSPRRHPPPPKPWTIEEAGPTKSPHPQSSIEVVIFAEYPEHDALKSDRTPSEKENQANKQRIQTTPNKIDLNDGPPSH